MSVFQVTKALANLSYSDMRILAKELNTRLQARDGWGSNPDDEHALAEVLASLGADLVNTPNPDEKKADQILRQVFSGRVKTVHIIPVNGGWQVNHGNHSAVATRLPDAVNNLLDQLVVLKAMGVSK